MKYQVSKNPTSNRSFTISTYTFASTGASGTVTASGGVDVSALEKGDSILFGLTASSASGWVKNKEYFVIPATSGTIQLADTKQDALNGTYTNASGNVGSGVIYPNYSVGGILFVGSTGNVNIRGIGVKNTGTSSFSIHKNISNGVFIPTMIKDISASGTTASDLVAWND